MTALRHPPTIGRETEMIVALAAALLAPTAPPAGLTMSCGAFDRSQRHSSFTLQLAGGETDRRIAILPGEGTAVIGALTGATLEEAKSWTPSPSSERWRLDSTTGSFILTAWIDARGAEALAEITIEEYRNGARGLNRTIAKGRCRGSALAPTASLKKLRAARALPADTVTPAVISVGPTTMGLQCRLVGADLALFRFDLDLTLDKDRGKAIFAISRAEGQPWPVGDLRVEGPMLAGRIVPKSQPDQDMLTIFVNTGGYLAPEAPISVLYKVEAWKGVIAGWIEISFKDNQPAGSGFCEPRGLTAADREQQQ